MSGRAIKKAIVPPKITPPKPANIFQRQRLFTLLDTARRDHRVIWISAPAGSGKTLLAASYIAARKLAVLWYQVDAGDSDVASFFHYLSLAAACAAPRHRRPLPVLTAEHLSDLPTFARNYFRQLYTRLPPASIIVLDNYQDVPEDSALHDVMHIAMSETPSPFNLLVLSRIEPPAALARLRLCQQAACIDWAKMQLTSDETAGISALRAGGRTFSRETLTALHARAHGWAAGLVLLLEQSRGGAVAADAPVGQKLLFDYFAAELFARTDPGVQTFLLQTALFPKIGVAAARALTGLAGAPEILDDLTRRNYFTVRHAGPGEDTYEYHPLFRDFLRAEAERRYQPRQLGVLRARAAALLEAKGEIEAAAELWREACDWSALKTHILKHAPAFVAQARFAAPESWLRALPEETIEQTPWLRYWLGVCRMPYDPLESRSLFESAYTAFREKRDPVGLYTAWAGAVDTFFYLWNDFARLDFWINELLALRERHPGELPVQIEARVAYGMFTALLWRQPQNPAIAEWSGRAEALMRLAGPSYHAMAGNNLYLYYSWWRGEPAIAGGYIERLKPLGRAADIAPLARSMWHVMEASHCGFSNRLPECEHVVADGLKLAEGAGVHLLDFLLHAQAVYGKLFAGDAAGGYGHLEQMERAMNPISRLDAAHYHYQSIWLALVNGDLPTAQRHVSPALEHAIACGAPHAHAFVQLTEAMVKIAAGEMDAAQPLLDTARAWGRGVGNGYVDHHCLLAHVYMHMLAGETVPAQSRLREALALGAAKGYISPPWIGWLRPILVELYAFALAHNIETDYVRAVIRARRLVPENPAMLSDNWPFPVKLYTLGRFALLRDDKPLQFSTKAQKKPLDFLKALVALGGRDVRDGVLAEELWPATDGDLAAQALDTTVHRLRKLLGEDAIARRDGRITLDARRVWVDAWAFERELAMAEEACRADDTSAAQAALQRLLRLYRGEFLHGDTIPAAVLGVRARLRAKFLRCLDVVGRYFVNRGRCEEAMASYQKGLDVDPAAEELYRGLLRCHLALGRHAEAIAVYRRCRDALARHLGTVPSAETEALYRAVLPP